MANECEHLGTVEIFKVNPGGGGGDGDEILAIIGLIFLLALVVGGFWLFTTHPEVVITVVAVFLISVFSACLE